MRRVVADIEADGLTPTQIWVIVTKEIGEEHEPKVWRFWEFDAFIEYARTVDEWVFHNGLGYDVPWINRLICNGLISEEKVWDTFVLSRLVRYSRYGTHSLDELGTALGTAKTEFNDWSRLTQEMINYCIDDVLLTEKVFEPLARFVDDPTWTKAIQCEQKMHSICHQMREDGFMFNMDLAKEVHADIVSRMDALEAEFDTLWPPVRTEVSRIQYRFKKNGELWPNVIDAIENKDTERDGTELVIYEDIGFNPGSTKHRIEKLWEAGWKPHEKTDTHYKFTMKGGPGRPWGTTGKKLTQEQYDDKKEYFDFYGWKVSEDNLETLPEDAPEGARKLAEWLTLQGRRKPLEEKMAACAEDGRVHPNFWHIGSWTHRMASSNPAVQNLSSPFHREPKNPVQEVKKLFDYKMREMFCVPEGAYLVGTDAESIQLRILAHYLRNDDYVHAIVSGSKDDGTDIHNVNRRALALGHLTREHAKTFIYAWLLGAGVAKVSRILECSMQDAKRAVEDFIANTEGLGELKQGLIRRDAARGYFEGIDGRRVIQNEEYYMLAGYLQNGETLVMKHANILWREWADQEKIDYTQVNFVHDEWQTEVRGSRDAAERIGVLQCDAITQVGKDLNLYCPLSGETIIGHNWLETH